MKNTLVILSGSPRGGDIAWKSMNKNLLSPLNADLALSYGNKFSISDYLESIATFNWIFEEPENWRDYLEKYYSPDLPNFFLEGLENGLGGIDGLKGSGAITFALKDILFQNHISKILEYDHVIYTRFDHFYFTKISHQLEEKIYIPEGEDYFGINERHAIIPNSAVYRYFSICEYIEMEYSNRKYEFLNTESVYNEHIKSLQKDYEIVRTRRHMACVAQEEDQTRWRKAEFNFFLKKNLKLKYPNEFMQSISNLIKYEHSLFEYIINFASIMQYSYLKIKIKAGIVKREIFKNETKN